MKFSRRSILRATAATLAAPALGAINAASLTGHASAQARSWKHGLSLFGELKYPEGFKNFDYVNPTAPQGGIVRQVAFGTFDNFNTVIGGVKGNVAAGTELFTETLMTPALDEVSTEYGLLADAVSHPDDHSSVTYRLNAKARWHDGKLYVTTRHLGILVYDPETKKLSSLVSTFHNELFKGPNDLDFDAEGNLFFTDPWGTGPGPDAPDQAASSICDVQVAYISA